MQFDQKDVEAVAASRVNRIEAKKTQQLTVIAMVLFLVGAIIALIVKNQVFGMIVAAAGILTMFYWQSVISGKQKKAKLDLVQKWQTEQRQ